MLADKAFSIRTPLQGELLDFVRGSGFDCTYIDGLIRDLVCLLGSYREEDVALFPEVFILPGVEGVASLAPGTQRIPVGLRQLVEGAGASILKDCANLAVDGWAVYVARLKGEAKPPQVEFGLFRALKHAYAASAEESMLVDALPAILIRNRGLLIVEVRNSKQQTFTASFTSAPAARSAFAKDVALFSGEVCAGLPTDKAKQFVPYLQRLLLDLLQHCHGTLLAAHEPPTDGKCPESLSDGVWLSPPLDLAAVHSEATLIKDAESLATLQAYESLLKGMINSDGVVVFGTDGTLLGYRIFLKPSDEEKKTASHKGGGRRRTYELMNSRLGVSLKAAFFRSQDGATECQKAG